MTTEAAVVERRAATGASRVKEFAAGVVIAGATLCAMGAVSAIALLLLGAEPGALFRQSVSATAMAVGAPLTTSAPLPGSPIPASIEIGLGMTATGITLVGVAVGATGLLRRTRRNRLVMRAFGMIVSFPALLAAAILLADIGRPATDLAPDPVFAMLYGLAGVLLLVVVCVLATRRIRVPRVLARARPAVVTTVRVLGGAAVVTMACGVLIAMFSGGGAAGGALLAGPSLLFAAFTRGLGVDWSTSTDQQTGSLLRALLDDTLPNSANGSVRPSALPAVDIPMWPLSVLAAALLLVCGMVVAAHTARTVRRFDRLVVRCAATLGVLTAATASAMTAMASMSLHMTVSAQGVTFASGTAELHGSVWIAALTGLAAGAVAGAAGALVIRARRHRSDVTDDPGQEVVGWARRAARDLTWWEFRR